MNHNFCPHCGDGLTSAKKPPKEGDTRSTFGRPMIFKGGKWVATNKKAATKTAPQPAAKSSRDNSSIDGWGGKTPKGVHSHYNKIGDLGKKAMVNDPKMLNDFVDHLSGFWTPMQTAGYDLKKIDSDKVQLSYYDDLFKGHITRDIERSKDGNWSLVKSPVPPKPKLKSLLKEAFDQIGVDVPDDVKVEFIDSTENKTLQQLPRIRFSLPGHTMDVMSLYYDGKDYKLRPHSKRDLNRLKKSYAKP